MASVPSAGERYDQGRTRWRTAGASVLAAAAFVVVAALLSSGLGLVDMARWAAAQQKAFHSMVSGLLSLKDGGWLAFMGLMAACLGYGFVHAAVPGHGKFLVAGAGLASRVSAVRLVALSMAGSLAQALTAIALVYGSFAALDITAGWAMDATNRVLIPASTLAIAVIGAVLARRGWRGLAGRRTAGACGHAAHGHEAGCGHRHGPTLSEADAVHGWRDAAALVFGIGIRPCTGAVFVLVAAWRIDLLAVGAAAAVMMALGTGALTSLVAVSATTARGATVLSAGIGRAGLVLPALQLLAGGAIVLAALALLVVGLLPL